MTYREGSGEERPRRIAVEVFAPQVRRSLCKALARPDGALLVSWEWHPGTPWVWGVGGVLGWLSTALALGYRFGNLDASPRPVGWVGLLAALCLSAAFLGTHVAVRLFRLTATPRGVFVYPFELIDSRSDTLEILPMSLLRVVRTNGARITLEFEGGRSFDFASSPASSGMHERIRLAQEQATAAASSGDMQALLSLDPFAPLRDAWPEDAPARPAPSIPWRHTTLASILLGSVVAAAATPLVLRASEERGVRLAEQDRDDDVLLEYLRRDGRAAQSATDARWRLALGAGVNGLLKLLPTAGARQAEVDRKIVEKIKESPSSDPLYRYLEVGGAEREWAERLLFDLAVQDPSEFLLNQYIQRNGKESTRIINETLPLKRAYLALKNPSVSALFAARQALLPQPGVLFPRSEEMAQVLERVNSELLRLRAKDLSKLEATLAPQPRLAQALVALIKAQPLGTPLSLPLVLHELTTIPPAPPGKLYRLRHFREPKAHQFAAAELGTILPQSWVKLDVSYDRSVSGRAGVPSLELHYQDLQAYETTSRSIRIATGARSGRLHGRLLLRTESESIEVLFGSWCSPWAYARERVFNESLREALTGTFFPCTQ
ncbi:MAG: hypothetical protein MUF64_03310 [Polyangiaceae bacterium]|jgi:hypothetical protein|nr:hypothetical protein [Polyangiaceae bacterium]